MAKRRLSVLRAKYKVLALFPKDGMGPGKQELQLADFVKLPKNVKGTNCGNCKHQEGGVCQFQGKVAGVYVDLKGLEVTPRECCAAWDSEGVVRPWKDE